MKALITLSWILLPTMASVLDAPIPGYGIEPFEFEIETTPGGPSIRINGTIEEAMEEIKKLNPNFSSEYQLDEADGLDRRAEPDEFHVNCFGRWVATESLWINKGIKYLKGVKGKPTNGPGPGNCGRVSCSEDSAIWWCNDSRSSKTLLSFTSIANGAQKIVQSCKRPYGNPFYHFTSGQAFHPTDWNVIVRRDWC